MPHKFELTVFLDTGLQREFVPLRDPTENPPRNAPKSLLEEIQTLKELWTKPELAEVKEQVGEIIDKASSGAPVKLMVREKFIQARLGEKVWHLRNGNSYTLQGIWFLIETNTSAQNGNAPVAHRHDRGYFYRKDALNEEEKEHLRQVYVESKGTQEWQAEDPFIPYENASTNEVSLFYSPSRQESDAGQQGQEPQDTPPLPEEVIPFFKEAFSFTLGVRRPAGEVQDVDLFLDLGNTRTAGLLFSHSQNQVPLNPDDFRAAFKVLRIKPDAKSGEYNLVDDVDAGIAQSWLVLHELEHQEYRLANQSKSPDLQLNEYKPQFTARPQNFLDKVLRRPIAYDVDGYVIKRIPQMFSQLSPVVLGDQAERLFNLPYATAMIKVGANLQQSSPKRYYWDNTSGEVDWHMLLNEWDPHYEIPSKATTFLPTIQGEMLRFMQTNGTLMDWSKQPEPAHAPSPFPEKPRYPKQSTLTWFLLRLLEIAYEQCNSSFARGADFIPHRLRKVLITYPSGWTSEEVSRYHQRCKEALDIFSQANIYGGVDSKVRLELTSSEDTPDEAVASQLPIVFSEIHRYPNLPTSDWISLVGKKRADGQDSVRIMNFDIGGGTTDISIVEYTSEQGYNNLNTTLLFKDGQNVAGDELVKQIIEKHIFGTIIQEHPKLAPEIKAKFTQRFNNAAQQSLRCKVIRSCLIPLATYCLSKLGDGGELSFSAQDAGVSSNNWQDLLDFLEVEQLDLPYQTPCVNCKVDDINQRLIEPLLKGLFENCAMYAAAFDIDLLIFSGKPSELPYIRTMAQKYIPIDNARIIFARNYKAGQWYPFITQEGCIKDAKTVTVVGAALYYALRNGLIAGWTISTRPNAVVENEWGKYTEMTSGRKGILLGKEEANASAILLKNDILARRRNVASAPEPVYRFKCNNQSLPNQSYNVNLSKEQKENRETLTIKSVEGYSVKDFELQLWPCPDVSGIKFWQEEGIFNIAFPEDKKLQ
ncbi:MAG: virulence factor SrfB [Victivallales bacterium]|nr:virulence factor SrfB [Victivallales bacterium]